jgi:TPR repeat protein
VVFRRNPLGVEAFYEEAVHWLQKASAQGSGEASEVLAQLLTRMQANGHGTTYTAADSDRFHALAYSQGFDVEQSHPVLHE